MCIITKSKKTIFDLKEELKEEAKELKRSKPVYKNQQRKLNGSDPWSDGETRQAFSDYWNLGSKINKLKYDFRHKHIAYCLLRGTPYELIESPRSDNQPNWTIIEGVKNEYNS